MSEIEDILAEAMEEAGEMMGNRAFHKGKAITIIDSNQMHENVPGENGAGWEQVDEFIAYIPKTEIETVDRSTQIQYLDQTWQAFEFTEDGAGTNTRFRLIPE